MLSDQRKMAALWDSRQEIGALRAENQRLREEHQAVLACINLYGDETLHKALDAIGWPSASEQEPVEDRKRLYSHDFPGESEQERAGCEHGVRITDGEPGSPIVCERCGETVAHEPGVDDRGIMLVPTNRGRTADTAGPTAPEVESDAG